MGLLSCHQVCFTGAANNLYINQPAVAAHVKSFENFCNLKLFKNKGRIVYLADEGKTLYDYAAKIFKREREIESAIEDMRELKRGILRLDTTKTYARYFMPFLISSFHEAYPHIKIHLDEGTFLDILFRIAAGEKPDQRIRTIMARMLAQWK